MTLQNTNAIVTGASMGLGKAIAEAFLKAGADIFLCARTAAPLRETLVELAGKYPERRVFGQPCDVSSKSEVDHLFAAAVEAFGTLDALVLNAGVYGPMGSLDTVDLDEWRRAMDINLYGVLFPCLRAIPHFKKTGHGKIVVLSGGGATNPLPNISAYAASKAAVIRLVETLSLELKDFHIDINGIAPGALATRMMDEVLSAGPEKVGQEFFQRNMQWKKDGGTPLDLAANLAVYLASRASEGITGKLISAQWDPWESLHEHLDDLRKTDVYTLRRITPKDRGMSWDPKADL
jgi:NAD(P)-dependent dehydrogenase (short-subunit alcohol dehydrogenase family)